MTQPLIQGSQIDGSTLTSVDASTLGGQPVGSGALDIVARDGSGNIDADTLGGQPVGVGANDIVALNASSQLPAVDGSLLTGLDGGTIGSVFVYSTNTTSGDPGSGNFRLNNTTVASATEMYIDTNNKDGADFGVILAAIDTGDRIYMQNGEDSAERILVTVVSNTDETGWFTIVFTVDDSNGPTWTNGKEFAMLMFLGSIGGGGGGGILIVDGDGDTQVQVEESADEDIIRFDTGDSQTNFPAQANALIFSSAEFTLGLPQANQNGIAGGAISLTAGQGSSTTFGAGGAVGLYGGAGGSTGGVGGAINIAAGAPSAGNYLGGEIDITAGNGNNIGAGGLVDINAGTGGNQGTGGAVTINAGDGGATSGHGGNLTLVSGSADGSGRGGFLNLYAGNASAGGGGDGGAIRIIAGDTAYSSYGGGVIAITGGNGGPVGEGGNVVLTGGNAGATGDIGGSVKLVAGTSTGTFSGNTIDLTAGDSGTGATGNGGAVNISAGDAASTNGSGGDIVLTPGTLTGSGADGVVSVVGQMAALDMAGAITLNDGGFGGIISNPTDRILNFRSGDATESALRLQMSGGVAVGHIYGTASVFGLYTAGLVAAVTVNSSGNVTINDNGGGNLATDSEGINITGQLDISSHIVMGALADFVMTERSDHTSTPAAGFGYIWTRNDAPTAPIFTDDTAVDHNLVVRDLHQDGGTITSATDIDPDAGHSFSFTFGAAATAEVGFSASDTVVAEVTVEVTNGGQGTLTWGTEVEWDGGAPTLTAAGKDLIKFYTRDSGTTWMGWVVALDLT